MGDYDTMEALGGGGREVVEEVRANAPPSLMHALLLESLAECMADPHRGCMLVFQEAEDELQLQEAAELEEDRLRSLQQLEKQCIEWTTDPGLGKDGGCNEHGGALRVYDGRVFQLVQEQPPSPRTRPQALRAGLFALADTASRFDPRLPCFKTEPTSS